MKIAINGMLLGGYFSGVEVTIRELAFQLHLNKKHDFHLFVPHDVSLGFDCSKNFIIHKIKLFPKSRLSRIFWEHFIFPGILKNENFDCLHCPGYIAPLSCPCPIVLTVHDCLALTHPEFCKISNRLYYGLLLKRSIQKAKAVIVPSKHIKETVSKLCPEKTTNIKIIPFAPSPAFGNTYSDKQLNSIKEKFNLPDRFILSVCNHEPKKNLTGIIESFKKFQNTNACPCKLVLTGPNSWGINTEAIKQNDNIITLGYVPLQELIALYQLADLFLFPSLAEGFGIPILEAMASKTPVITSNYGSPAEISNQSAYLIDPENYDDIANGIQTLLSSPDLILDFKTKGLENAKNYNWTEVVKKTIETYENLIYT